jgi:hypothetical protein
MSDRLGRLTAVLLALVVSACGVAGGGGKSTGLQPTAEDVGHGDPGESIGEETVEEDSPEPLTMRQLKRFYAAQVEWRTCAVDEGLVLPDPPTLEQFVAGGGSWWVGHDLSEEEWNRMVVGDESGGGSLGEACGEPPTHSDFTAE